MRGTGTSLEDRVAQLENKVGILTQELAALRGATAAAPEGKSPPSETSPPPLSGAEASEELIFWVDRAYILPRIATTSFILVVALSLRTLTDARIIDLELGTLIGMLYAFGLIIYGWSSYGRKSAQAPVFALWGTIVLCSVVVETHRVFQSLPTVIAYLLLALTGWTTVIMSRRYQAALPVFAGTIGMSFAAFAINFPSPIFPLLTIILILANAFAAYATHLLRASWLRWLLLILTLLMIQIWTLKLGIYLDKVAPADLDPSLQWFLPAIAALAFAYSVIALLGVLGRLQDRVSKFDIVLPVINVIWFFFAARSAIGHGLTEPHLFAFPALIAGAAHLGVAWWLARRGTAEAHGTTSFALAGGLLLSLALPLAFGHALLASTAIAALALGLGLAAERMANGGVRLVSYLLQFYATASLVFLLQSTDKTEPSLIGAAASGLLALIGAYHYYWARQHPPPSAGTLTDRFNADDRCAALLLVAALTSGFFTLRTGLYQALVAAHIATPQAFSSGQSILIDATAIILLLVGLNQRNKELRNVGILIALVATAKVCLDLLGLKGFPLLLSLFSFGSVATIASIVLGRWGRSASRD
ncbi:MAG: hypothetical protein A2091_11235 [Desulfuromonadales bacterium GWD2_61_12]|nr:MAG: hypothetical protein A2091_11235 [Desulfuromonadales bacterium GWD2_61_12]